MADPTPVRCPKSRHRSRPHPYRLWGCSLIHKTDSRHTPLLKAVFIREAMETLIKLLRERGAGLLRKKQPRRLALKRARTIANYDYQAVFPRSARGRVLTWLLTVLEVRALFQSLGCYAFYQALPTGYLEGAFGQRIAKDALPAATNGTKPVGTFTYFFNVFPRRTKAGAPEGCRDVINGSFEHGDGKHLKHWLTGPSL